jgi:ABC-type bacteriocin/lantibiotic exporter with double-glycine peptidase domain
MSASDNDTECAMMELIENLGDELIVIFVANRMTILQSCRQIVVLENRRIKRSGSYKHIIDR